MNRTTARVSNNDIANALYIGNASDDTYATVFTKDELVELWEKYCIYTVDENGNTVDPTASYDDEVYNALDRYGYWDNIY